MLQARQPQLALEAFRNLMASPLRPNVVTWASVISGLLKQSKKGMPYAQQAYQLWKELESSGLQAGNASAHAAGRTTFCTTSVQRLRCSQIALQYIIRCIL